MRCPQCSYDLTGSSGDTCPECGVGVMAVATSALRLQTRMLYAGIALVVVYCIAQTVWFWEERNMFLWLVASGGQPDPAAMADSARITLWARYVSNLSLGMGITCIALALFGVFRRVAAQLPASNRSE